MNKRLILRLFKQHKEMLENQEKLFKKQDKLIEELGKKLRGLRI